MKKIFTSMALLLCASVSNVMAEDVTVTWAYNAKGTVITDAATSSSTALTASASIGSGLSSSDALTSTQDDLEDYYAAVTSSSKVESKTDGYCVTWTIKVAEGYTFTPSSVSSNVARGATDGCTLVVYGVDNESAETALSSNTYVPRRANKKSSEDKVTDAVTSFTESISGYTVEGGQSFSVRVYIYNHGASKNMGFNNFVISGTVEASAKGTTETSVQLSRESVDLDIAGTKTSTLTATVLDASTSEEISGKTVSWTSSDEKVATVEDGKITAVTAGTATISASFAGDDTYKASSASCTVTVADTRDDMSITLSSSTLNVAPSSTGTVTVTYYNSTKEADGNTSELKIESSDETVATATLSGTTLTINGVAAGSATITISSAESTTQKAASATLTVAVCEPLEAVSSATFDGSTVTKDTYKSQTNVNNIMIYATSSKTVKVSDSGFYLSGGASVSNGVINPCGLEVLVQGPVSITVTQNANEGRTLKIDAGSENLGSTKTTGSDVTETFNYEGTEECSIYIYSGGSGITVKSIVIAPLASEGKEISVGYQYTTHCYDVALDFSDLDVTAYYVSAVSSTEATLATFENNIVPAKTGFIVKNDNYASTTTITVPEAASEGTAVESKLVGVLEATPIDATSDNATNYILYNGEFIPTSGGTLGANRAYLPIESTSTSGAKLSIVFEGATGINEVNAAANNGKIYNLQGIEVKNADKGLFIINGKKVIK